MNYNSVSQDAQLYVCAINGHRLSDNANSVIETIKDQQVIYYENHENFMYLARHFGINLDNKDVRIWNKDEVLSRLGSVPIVLVTDDGYAAFCDPGWEIVQVARKRNIHINIVPQVSAPISAVILSGYLSDQNYHSFYFGGMIYKPVISDKFISGMKAAKDSCSVFLATHPDIDDGLTDIIFKEVYEADREITLCLDIGRPSQNILTTTINNFYETLRSLGHSYDYVTYVVAPNN